MSRLNIPFVLVPVVAGLLAIPGQATAHGGGGGGHGGGAFHGEVGDSTAALDGPTLVVGVSGLDFSLASGLGL
jgi:hypothetical protein